MTTSQQPILVFAAGGRQGRAAAEALMARGFPVRALARRLDDAAVVALRDAGAEVIAGDLDDAASIERALTGVRAAFLYQPGFISEQATPGLTADSELARGRAVITAARAAGLGQLVYSSALGADTDVSPYLAPKTALEAELAASGLTATVLRPVGFMENYAGPGRGLQRDGRLVTAADPDAVEQLIAVRDVGELAADAIADPGRWAGVTAEIAGDELTPPQIAAALAGAVAGRIAYEPVTIEQVRATDPRRAATLAAMRAVRLPRADIVGLRTAHPGLLDFSGWLAGGGAELVAGYLDGE